MITNVIDNRVGFEVHCQLTDECFKCACARMEGDGRRFVSSSQS